MATQDQIDNFHEFATRQLANGGAEKSVDELFDAWRVNHPSPHELSESVAAIRASLADMENGDTGRPVDDVIAELRQEVSSKRQ